MRAAVLDSDVSHELVIANRILSAEGVVDAFGHVSVRHPQDPDMYIIGRSLSPEQITIGDLQTFHLDGTHADGDDRVAYAERAIHGAIYEKRPDVHAVCHNHSPSVIPFGVTGIPLQPLFHMAGLLGSQIPIWDIRRVAGETDMLVHSLNVGRSLAEALENGRVVLMRGHGSVVAGGTLREAVTTAVYMEQNARLQLQSMSLGEVTYLSDGEIERTSEMLLTPIASDRAWTCWRERVGF